MHKILSIQSPRIIVLTIIFGFSFVACAKTPMQVPSQQGTLPTQVLSQQRTLPTQAPSQQGTLNGILMSGPTCPHSGPPACANQPVRYLPIQIKTSDGQVRTTVTTDQNGHFSATLPAGSYLVVARFGMRGLQSKAVTVTMDHTTTIQITLDTGIR